MIIVWEFVCKFVFSGSQHSKIRDLLQGELHGGKQIPYRKDPENVIDAIDFTRQKWIFQARAMRQEIEDLKEQNKVIPLLHQSSINIDVNVDIDGDVDINVNIYIIIIMI